MRGGLVESHRLHPLGLRDVALHLIGSAEAQANPVEFFRQVRAAPLTAEIRGEHRVDGRNEASCEPGVAG